MQVRVPEQRRVQVLQRARKSEPGLAQQLVRVQQQALVRARAQQPGQVQRRE
jgi:hypothetical protein